MVGHDLSNIYLKPFDIQLYNKLKRLKCDNIIYTRYVDDMVISFKKIENHKEIEKEKEKEEHKQWKKTSL